MKPKPVFIGTTWTLERDGREVFITRFTGQTVPLSQPVNVPRYVRTLARKLLKP